MKSFVNEFDYEYTGNQEINNEEESVDVEES